ncbi:MAG: hypothetical protein HFG50_16335 [Lachnospiraceae bacterium]|jgi:hypothetical protein|nr:hypothetical protein [Lachnospiraceae bacterium]
MDEGEVVRGRIIRAEDEGEAVRGRIIRAEDEDEVIRVKVLEVMKVRKQAESWKIYENKKV